MNLGDSKSNEAEAALVKMHVGNLIAAGVREEDVAVITPYNAQVCRISLFNAMDCDLGCVSGDLLACRYGTAAPIRKSMWAMGSLSTILPSVSHLTQLTVGRHS